MIGFQELVFHYILMAVFDVIAICFVVENINFVGSFPATIDDSIAANGAGNGFGDDGGIFIVPIVSVRRNYLQ